MKSTFLSAISNILHYGSISIMNQRTPDDFKHELQALDTAHAQNEAARDSFVALAHTALFAASVSFVGSAVPLAKAVWPYALVAGWAIDVLGLLARTVSFATARKAVDARRAALYDDIPPVAAWSERLNGFALWSFPAALLCLFSFVTANVVSINEREASPSASTAAIPIGRIEGDSAAATRAVAAGGRVAASNGRCSGATGSGRPTTAAAASGACQEVGCGAPRR
jgi:hypothetical protein